MRCTSQTPFLFTRLLIVFTDLQNFENAFALDLFLKTAQRFI